MYIFIELPGLPKASCVASCVALLGRESVLSVRSSSAPLRPSSIATKGPLGGDPTGVRGTIFSLPSLDLRDILPLFILRRDVLRRLPLERFRDRCASMGGTELCPLNPLPFRFMPCDGCEVDRELD
jgi:hypothetical protein